MESSWLDSSEQRTWRSYVVAGQLLNSQLERDLLAAAGLSMADYAVLVNLSEVPEHQLRATVLAERMSWSRSRLSHQVGRMETRGLVKRENCGDDARGSFIELTDEGFQTIKDAAPAHVQSVRTHLLSLLTPDQAQAITGISETILAHLAQLGAVPADCPSAQTASAQTPSAQTPETR